MALEVQVGKLKSLRAVRASPANCPPMLRLLPVAAMRALHWQSTVTAATAGGAYIPAAAAER